MCWEFAKDTTKTIIIQLKIILVIIHSIFLDLDQSYYSLLRALQLHILGFVIGIWCFYIY